ncbi:MAG: MFS transporter [Micrococcales bacterium]|nr:MFS transporter [Micrococcales bacterium]
MSAATSDNTGRLKFLKGRWIEGWDPENEEQWEREGSKIARRNLGFSVYAEFLGFVVWALWAITVPRLGKYGIVLTDSEQFTLISTPALVGATLRFPYTYMVAKIGGRNWTIVSASLLLIPTTAMAWAISNQASFHTLWLVAALAGFGGGNFASSMANITFFFPQKTKGWALGLNAAGGNIGSAIAQFTVPILVTVTVVGGAAAVTAGDAKENLPIAGWFWVPFILLAIGGAIWGMNNLTSAKNDLGGIKASMRDPHQWILSFLYIGTFGSFIGLGAAFPKLLSDQFPESDHITIAGATVVLAFLGPLVGSLIRPVGGRLADRFGGAYITVLAFVVMIVAIFTAIQILESASKADEKTGHFWPFLLCFMVLFTATGAGNGSMYKMIPTVFHFKAGVTNALTHSSGVSTERKIAATLGIVSAFGAYGGWMVPEIFKKAIEQTKVMEQKVVEGVPQLTPDGDPLMVNMNLVGGYQRGMWWLLTAYVVFLVVLIAAYVIPYARRGTRV